MVESGGLENRCTFTGTVGSNPTLSASQMRNQERSPNGMAPRWKRGGPLACAGSSPAPSANLNAECGISALRIPHSYQAPASVQSRPHESRQDRKVATVVSFGCAAAVTGA